MLDPTGRFFAGGVPLEHPGVVAAFSRWIERAPNGRYALRNDLHYVYVEVQGAPLQVRAIVLDGARAELVLQGGEREPLRAETLREGPDGQLYLNVRDGTWTARVQPAAALALEPLLDEGPEGILLRLGDATVIIPRVDDPLQETKREGRSSR